MLKLPGLRDALAAALLVAGLAGALAGCGGADADASGRPSANASSTPRADIPLGGVQAPSLRRAPKLDQSRDGVRDVALRAATCRTAGGQRTVSGTVSNPTSSPLDYVITVNWTNATSDVLGNAVTVVKSVAPGARVPWQAMAVVGTGATQCVLDAQRGRLADG